MNRKVLLRSVLFTLCAALLWIAAAGAVLPGQALAEDGAGELFNTLCWYTLTASSGAGGWEGWLKIENDGVFNGYYYDTDDSVTYEVSFSGEFLPTATEKRGETVYALWVESLETDNVPGTEAESNYGDRIVYDDAPFGAGEYLLLTLPGTPADEIPETVRAEIGGTWNEWDDYSRFFTLTREDGWGFFADSTRSAKPSQPDPTRPPVPDGPMDGEILIDDDLWTLCVTGKDRVYGQPYYTLRMRNKSSMNLSLTIRGQVRYYDIRTFDMRHEDISKSEYGSDFVTLKLPMGCDITWQMFIQANGLELDQLDDLRMVDLWCQLDDTDAHTPDILREYQHVHIDWDDRVTLDDLLTPRSLISPQEISGDPSLISIKAQGTYLFANGQECILCQVTNHSDALLSVSAAGTIRDYTTDFFFEPSCNGKPYAPESVLRMKDGTVRRTKIQPGETVPMFVTYKDETGRNVKDITDASFVLFVTTPAAEKSSSRTVWRYACYLHFDPAPAVQTAAPTPTPELLPKNVTRLPNGNLRYDNGLISFEYTSQIYPSVMKAEGETVIVLFAPPYQDKMFTYQVFVPELDRLMTYTELLNMKLSPAGASELADQQIAKWREYEEKYDPNVRERAFVTVSGRKAVRYRTIRTVPSTDPRPSDYILWLSDGVLWLRVYEHPTDDLQAAIRLFLNTLEVRNAVDTWVSEDGSPSVTQPPATPAPTDTPAPTTAPAPAADLSPWIGYWKTHDDSYAEMIITDNGDGTLQARAMFLAAGDTDAVLRPEADGSMRFESRYGNLTGSMIRGADGTLRLAITGGYTMEDDEATEYQGYYARGFVYYPAAYEEMWYQTPEDAASTEDDWIGTWTAQGGEGEFTLSIGRKAGGLGVEITLGRYHFSGMADLAGDTVMAMYDDDFNCLLLLNRKLQQIAMMEVGSSIDEVYDLVGNPYYGAIMFRRSEINLTVPEEFRDAVNGTPPDYLLTDGSGSLLPIPGESGWMQVPASRVNATSYIVGKNPDAYRPERAIDGDEATAFQFSTKTTKLGKAFLEFDFDTPVSLDQLWIKNGFWKAADGKDMYTRNSRVKKMTVFIRSEGSGKYRELKAVTLKDDGWQNGWKTVDLGRQTGVTGVRIRIDAKYAGSKYPNDVCISEIMFVQAVNP